MSKKLFELCAELVMAQASGRSMTTEEMEEALLKTFSTLQKIQKAEDMGVPASIQIPEVREERPAAEAVPKAAMDPKSSIQEDRVICLECGSQFRQLTANHLKSHGLTPREYKKKWGFRLKDSLAAKSLTRARSEAAKERGIPDKLREFLESRKHGH
ncbi:MucR family transcriptional regulator [Desulfoglaeba alkanexedens]|uniref:MucR family transcriptional regulator n=1 Tax=Desulfoglaeba alkanexedens ALDC TaxID=980445 RepID=A0A4P8L4A9_9BACT|nr:MucR family transcriptional regulator [Desulfoglaeba alkanexedens]QCQ22739.1 MucR family transcriptional regulator [Desulfoglaeba alkanexedens ALDC]